VIILLSEQTINSLTKSVRKDDSLVQRLSVVRKKSVTPSLKLVKPRHPPPQPRSESSLKLSTTRKTPAALPFVEEDASPLDNPPPYVADVQLDRARSQPLRDLPLKAVNSPKKTTHGMSPAEVTKPLSDDPQGQEDTVDDSVLVCAGAGEAWAADTDSVADPKENAVPKLDDEYVLDREGSATNDKPVEAKKIRLNEDIQSLLDRRKEAPISAEAPLQGRRRKERKLGRAPSNASNPSAPASFIHSKSIEIADSTASASPLDLSVPLPSQQLGYETADAKEHRARMSKRMGTNFSDGGGGVRVESIGIVKDVEAEDGRTGVGARVRGRHRQAKA